MIRKPSKSTFALYKQIQADQLDEPELAMALKETDPTLETVTPSMLEVLGNLTHLQETLADLQNQVEQNIQQIELALNATGSSPSPRKTLV